MINPNIFVFAKVILQARIVQLQIGSVLMATAQLDPYANPIIEVC
jgi:hypothetical protein